MRPNYSDYQKHTVQKYGSGLLHVKEQKIRQIGRSCGSYCKELVRSPTGGSSLGKAIRRGAVQEWIGQSTDMRMSRRAQQTRFALIGLRGCMNMCGEKAEPQTHVENTVRRLWP